MNPVIVERRLRRIEDEIRKLRLSMERAETTDKKVHGGLRALKGAWKDFDLSYEEIQEAEYRMKEFPE